MHLTKGKKTIQKVYIQCDSIGHSGKHKTIGTVKGSVIARG